MNPAREVKTERFSWVEGKTPAFVEGDPVAGGFARRPSTTMPVAGLPLRLRERVKCSG